MSQYAATSSLLADILQEFDRLYSAEKIRRGISEFSDMPRFMLKLLLNDDGTLTDYAHRLASNYDEIYIDEYQDVNEIQDTIFRIIGGSHRFMVGDIKQSIYGFREAEPSIFASYRRDFSAYDENDDTPLSHEYDGRTIFMSENFRCDENVIKFANAVCSDVFGAFSESIGYTEQDDLKFSKALPSDNYQSPKVSVNIVHRFEGEGGTADTEAIEDEAQENPRDNYKDLSDEAIVVANQIADLLRNGKNADGTPVRAKNIAVLVRGHRHAKPLIAALKMLNVRYLESSKGELFDGEDMRLLIDLLSVIDNPRSDIPLCHLLTAQHEGISPVMTLEGVITVRRAAENSKSLFDALISYAESGDDANLAGACRDFVALIEKMRIASSKISADKLIKSIVACEQYCALTRTSAYTYVYDSACKYVKNSWSGLYGFLKYFKGVIQKGEGGAEPDSKDADAVTIMTIHQSKGLEFNVCFLFGFGKALSLSEKSPIIFNRDFGASLKLPPINDGDTDLIGGARYESNPIYNAVEAYNRRRLIEEEARIFYVALTRARERLYVSATMTGYISNLLTKLEDCADPQYEITASGSYIRWILLSSLHNADMSDDVIDLNFFYRGEQYLTAPFPKATMAEINANTEGVERERAELICAADIGDAQASVFSTVPSKVAASKVSPNMLDDSIFIPVPTGALFSESDEDASEQSSDNADRVRQRIELMRSAKKDFDGLLEINKKPSAAEIGTATHLFLQYCDYKNAAESGIEAEISRLVSGRFISKRSAKIINRHQLRHFFEGELYSLISSAKKVRREFRFGMFRDAREFTQNQELQELLQDKKIFVQGSIDLIIERADGEIILCDYKTDFVSDDERANRDLLVDSMRKKHGEQIKQYKYATEQIFGTSPARTCIYSLPLGELIDM
jgi:ATP-dependent helicase/nuclease subunit A